MSAGGHRYLRILGSLVCLFLGGMLIYSGLVKAADPGLFADEIRGYKIFPSLAAVAAFAFVWIEIILGVLLISGIAPRPALLGCAGLMLFFAAVTAWSWAHGNTEGCGCFGRLSRRAPGEVILEDLGLVALAAVGFATSPWTRYSRWRVAAVAVLLPVLLATSVLAPRLPVDSLVTPLRPGADLENLAADDLKAPLSEGRVFVALLGDGCAACVDALPKLELLGQSDQTIRLAGIFAGDRASRRAWALKHVPAFPVGQTSAQSLRQYYRRLPVFFLLEEGRVRRIWWNRVPDPAEVLNTG